MEIKRDKFGKFIVGSSKRIDITGCKFNRLTAIKFINFDKIKRKTYWLFRCDCGNFKIIDKSSVVNIKSTNSCGCLLRESLKKGRKPRKGANFICRICKKNFYRCPRDIRKKKKELFCSKDCAYKARIGVSFTNKGQFKKGFSPNWKGGITAKRIKSGFYKRDYNSIREWKKKVLKRDYWKCKLCESKNNLNAHHILFYSDFPDQRLVIKNGLTLCSNCHLESHRRIKLTDLIFDYKYKKHNDYLEFFISLFNKKLGDINSSLN